MMQDCVRLIRFIGFNKQTSSKNSIRATQVFWCFFSLLVLLSLYTLVWSALSSDGEDTHPFLFTWVSLLSLLLVHHIISACAEKCEIFVLEQSYQHLRLCRLPTLVRFGGVIFLLAGLIMHTGHTLSHFLSFASTMHPHSHHSSEKGSTFSTINREQNQHSLREGRGVGMNPQGGTAGQKNPWGGVFHHERVERDHNDVDPSFRKHVKEVLFSEEDPLHSTVAFGSILKFLSDLPGNDFFIPLLLISTYLFLLFIFRAWMLRMDAVVGSAEEDLESLSPLGIEVSKKAFSVLKNREDKNESLRRCHGISGNRFRLAAFFPWLNSLVLTLHSRLKDFSPFYKHCQLFIFPAFMLLSCTLLPTILGRGIWSFYVEGFIVLSVTVGILIRSIYVLIPMLRFLMNQNIGAGSAEYSKEVMKTLTENIAAIPGVLQVSRYAWWKVGKQEDHRFFLQLKIAKEGDAGAISSAARKCLSALLQAHVYVECEQEGGNEDPITGISMNEEERGPRANSKEKEIEEEWSYGKEEDKELILELRRKCNFRMNIPFHQPYHDPSLMNSQPLHSHENSHCAHGHSHNCSH